MTIAPVLGSNHTLLAFNQNYSSWSLRPIIFIRKHKLPIKIVSYNLIGSEAVKAKVPTALLPALEMEVAGKSVIIPDSLAILETLADLFPVQVWPQDALLRAKARTIAAEMHSGFSNLRNDMTCNLRARYTPTPKWSDATAANIHRILTIWQTARAEASQLPNDDGWLFGSFTAADAMYFPIVTRFLTYRVEIDETKFPLAKAYFDRVLRDDTVREMYEIAYNEEAVVDRYEGVYPGQTKEKLVV
ncbi:hypothetical protein BCR33DRAFT_719590 [Rhizoclosmatium globosum]|uniref:GST N-terminal domain-containing protein n=1 Tax=Rhizoclosmatium globosum TaxID=329046 RepID=A0A1Y2C012_9FUNG|nr:hypothetical protein BCR33DRAFT_719590 [Rhizoclosmatium globosum]|eukprot:ORY40217.1 hypothetical protein BCR33DRAFT_719590 [Rhizoclosmatium globosum]